MRVELSVYCNYNQSRKENIKTLFRVVNKASYKKEQ